MREEDAIMVSGGECGSAELPDEPTRRIRDPFAVPATEQRRMDEQRDELVETHAATRDRWGRPNRVSIARSVSRCPPYALGSTSRQRPSVHHSTFPDHRSPCRRCGGSAGPAIAATPPITFSTAATAPGSSDRASQASRSSGCSRRAA
jgi:hypothetical protein